MKQIVSTLFISQAWETLDDANAGCGCKTQWIYSYSTNKKRFFKM